ncbi:MAG: plsX [Phenylobacterium sp.]|nr:plsX [Phenylobacterium sp.]
MRRRRRTKRPSLTEPLVISIDAMGGDHGPSVVIPAVAHALAGLPRSVRFLLHGDEAALAPELARCRGLAGRAEVRHAERVIANDEKPAQALRRGKGTSMWNAVESIREGAATAALSAGNTGALMAISKLLLRMCADLDRPALVATMPTPRGFTTFLDVGANVDCDAERLIEFAIMGEAFHRAAHGVPHPTVGLLNVGSEEMKGHEEVREANRILREDGYNLNYRGFVEGDDLTGGAVDVVVTDGFTGNVALKAMEGAARFITNELRSALTSSLTGTLGAALARPALRKFRDRLSPPPAAPLLGLNGMVLKCHGSSNEAEFAHAVRVAVDLARSDFAAEIERNMRRRPVAAVVEPGASAAEGGV